MSLPESMVEVEITAPGGPEVLKTRSVSLPRPAPGELLIRVLAAGVNRPDVLQRSGKYPLPPGANPIPGLEIAGEIVAVGADARGFVVGERVCALTNGGGYAEYCVVPAGQTLPIPAGMDALHAAAIPETFFTVWANLFELGGARAGDRVLIHGGTSGIGTTALMLCRERGIQAFATAGSAEKCAAIGTLGAEAINYRDENFADVIRARTNNRGVDIILDIMGAAYFERNLQALAQGGRLIIIGLLGGAVADNINLAAIMARRATLTGSMMRSRTAAEKATIATALFEQVWPALAAGRCLPIIDKVFPLAEAAAAQRRMEAGEHIGKIVLNVAQ
ncbi:MAG TPA: NAD(P)H-quinone oxidoreductase [Spongiibacteraceae bacterium]|nr:NAD(P)H-quinone oxidoreductase [Spongiibacteraceae bacterium]